jgi:propanol-preferring alcohol dehydrogenase
MNATYRAVEVSRPGEFSEIRKPLLDPGPNQVRIRVEACGVCHSDSAGARSEAADAAIDDSPVKNAELKLWFKF